MSFSADELQDGARAATGLDDFGSSYYREGLERTVDGLNNEADLNDLGQVIQHATISNALIQRLKIVDTYKQHPEIADEVVDGPVVILGLPRTGTTALGQLIANDPQFRSLRTWESQAPTPPPEAATQYTDPRIAQAAEGIAMIDSMFPDFQAMNSSEPEAATECQDLMGMSFRTYHFDGVVRVPSYIEWLLDTDMRETYEYHEQVLKLLQWHCKPNLWHLRTPVHMFALDAFVEVYPNAKFLWSHRDPAKVLGSVCSLISYIRSWSSDRKDPHELGAEQLAWWAKGIGRAMEFRKTFGDDRFVDVSFADLQTDSVKTVADSYEQLGLEFSDAARAKVQEWADGHKPGQRGTHTYELADFGLTEGQVREASATTSRPTTLRRDRIGRHDSRQGRWAQEARARSSRCVPHYCRPPRKLFGRKASGPCPSHVCSAGPRWAPGRSTGTSTPRTNSYRHSFSRWRRLEVVRLRQRMAVSSDPVRAVAAWIDGRLDLAFNEEIRSDLRQMSLEAQNQMFAAPEIVAPAYREILRPLVEELTRGRDLGLFSDIDTDSEALSIQGVVWSNVERHWATAGADLSDIRAHVERFCLRGLGVAPETIITVIDEMAAGKF